MLTIVIFPRFVVSGARLPRRGPRRSVGASRGVCRGRVPAGLTADEWITWLMRSDNRRENRVHGKSMRGDAAVGKRSTRPPSGF